MMVSFVWHLVILVAFCGSLTRGEGCEPPENGHNMSRRDVLDYLLQTSNRSTKYDPRVPPDFEKEVATNVSIRIHLLSFDSVSMVTMDYSVDLYLTMQWTDSRLNYSCFHDSGARLEVDTKMMNNVWVPDVYFRNAKEASFHDVTVPNKYMHIKENAKVEYSMRLSLTMSCRMVLEKYPLDTQKCPMMIQSYTYTTENVIFRWYEEDDMNITTDNESTSSDTDKVPITYDADIVLDTELPQFSIIEKETCSCNGTMDKGSPTFACIRAFFTLKRDIGFYLIQVYVPSILIVALSWVSFWLDLEAIPARVSLGVLTVLTLNTHGSSIQSQLPKVSYIKAIDVWVVSSLIFVFAALLEFAYVNVLARRGDREQCGGDGEEHQQRKRWTMNGNRPKPPPNHSPPSRSKARRVDKISRILFPMAFIVFNAIYWLYYIYSPQSSTQTLGCPKSE